MSTPDPTGDDRQRPASPMWTTPVLGQFRLELSWDDDSARWLEVVPDAELYTKHSWRLVLREATGTDVTDLTVTGTEVLAEKVLAQDLLDLLATVQADPSAYDRSPA